MGGNKRVCARGPVREARALAPVVFTRLNYVTTFLINALVRPLRALLLKPPQNNCRIVYRTKHFRWSIRTVVVVILGALARRKDVVHRTDALGEAPVHRHHLELGRSDLGDVALDVALVRVTGPHQLRVHQHFACTPPGQLLVVVVNFGTIQKRFQEQQTNAHADRRHMAKHTKQSMKFVRVCDLIELLVFVDKLQ